ncbi:Gag-pol fusion protein [Phytophthora cinnamomi]|uniref:Gag-pol fusion protein n=1 Tax=Phytophthora cinnamomi TaxID=4785 RepID=UPI003559B1C6|nr:Gag-pol fusion protein [Phytophthora cinnamomi]
MRTRAVHNVEVVVPAKDGAMGLFMPQVRKQSHLLLAPTLVTVRDGKAVVPVLNLVGRTSKLPSKEKLGTWVPTDREMDILELDGELDRERVSAWLESLRTTTAPLSNEDELNIGEMEDKDKELIFTLLRNFPSLLELTTGCPPATTLGVVHHINTGSEPPVKVWPRRHSRSEHETIDAEVKAMFHDGVIEEGTGAWGFLVVLVRKKDGTVRFCVDYRMLDAITKKDIYPLPRIDETLESMLGARRFTSLDMHAGYWQVPVAEDSKDKTGFVTRQGLFRFVRMPFGLANAPGTFQRMMDAVLRGLAWKRCLVYLDDVIVFSSGTV